MKITNLLAEAELFRYQHEWEDKDGTPVIHMKGRTSRHSNSPNVGLYAWSYAMERMGVNCPKRWRSTFCTTDTGGSSFFGEAGFADGIREIIIPDGTPVAVCVDDYNYNRNPTEAFSPQDLMNDLTNFRDSSSANEQTAETVSQAAQLLGKCNHGEGNDEGFEVFTKFLSILDKLAAEQMDVMMELHNNASYTSLLLQQAKEALDKKVIQVFPSASLIPNDDSFEVWFEGDYEAHLHQDETQDDEYF